MTKGCIAVLSPFAARNGFVRFYPPSNTWFLGPTWVSPPNGISIGSVVFAQYVSVTNTESESPDFMALYKLVFNLNLNTQTDRQTCRPRYMWRLSQ